MIGLAGWNTAANSGFELVPVAAMMTGPKPSFAWASKVVWNSLAVRAGQSRWATMCGRLIITAL